MGSHNNTITQPTNGTRKRTPTTPPTPPTYNNNNNASCTTNTSTVPPTALLLPRNGSGCDGAESSTTTGGPSSATRTTPQRRSKNNRTFQSPMTTKTSILSTTQHTHGVRWNNHHHDRRVVLVVVVIVGVVFYVLGVITTIMLSSSSSSSTPFGVQEQSTTPFHVVVQQQLPVMTTTYDHDRFRRTTTTTNATTTAVVQEDDERGRRRSGSSLLLSPPSQPLLRRESSESSSVVTSSSRNRPPFQQQQRNRQHQLSTERTFPSAVSLRVAAAIIAKQHGSSSSAAASSITRSSFRVPPLQQKKHYDRPKYDRLNLFHDTYMNSGQFGRQILPNDMYHFNYERKVFLEEMNDDEDSENNEKEQEEKDSWVDYYDHFEERDYPRTCIMPSWKDQQFPTCNIFHEFMTIERLPVPYDSTPHSSIGGSPTQSIRYLSHGHYRDTYLWEPFEKKPVVDSSHDDVDNNNSGSYDGFVLKRLRLQDYMDVTYTIVDQMRTEALLMEQLSGSTRTTNIYGYCSTSMAVERAQDITMEIVPFDRTIQKERGRISQKKLDVLEAQHNNNVGTNGELFSMNKLTKVEKLDMALQIAEGIAEMHGFVGSVIVNDDVHPDQWLQRPAKKPGQRELILNDMNNAVFLEWNPTKQEYCPYYQQYGGDFHAPEEFLGGNVDESVDLWSMANMIFTLLTGLWPYYDVPYEHRQILQQRAMDGELPYINPAYARHSYIEQRLVEVMMLCYKRNPQDRITIFDVVKHLRHTQQTYNNAERQQQQSPLHSVIRVG